MYFQGEKKSIVRRLVKNNTALLHHIHPLLARLFLARGVASEIDLDRTLAKIPSPWLLSGMDTMVNHLIVAVKEQQRISIVADFDADGATSCALAIKGLQLLGAGPVTFVVPNRFEYGYGLTPEIVELVKHQNPQVIITVDNGISSIEGVAVANAAGIKVLITDHHLPGEQLPDAAAIVNPNLVGDKFPNKSLAGVGVMFYVLMALRSKLREIKWFELKNISEPNLAQLLDFVALGTVADVVSLEHTNRALVHQGILRIRNNQCHAGIKALIEVAGKNTQNIVATDLGFSIGPRLNAAGRMDDMSLGIQCLLADDPAQARLIALKLDGFNEERKEVEATMKQEAMLLISDMKHFDKSHLPSGLCIYDASWHQGVIGILASRIKDQLHRPVIAFAPAGADIIKGSARSIVGVHVRDVLSDIAAAYPKLLSKFGGHAMAAGLTISMHDYPTFALAFDEMVTKRLDGVDLEQKILSDGELTEAETTLEIAELIQNGATWGQDFPEPVFDGVFDVIQVRIVGQRHLKFVLRRPDAHTMVDAIAFFADKPEHWLGLRQIRAAYKLDINEYKGNRSVQFIVHYFEKLA